MKYARGLTRDTADKFVGMYVNKRTLDYGEDGKKAVKEFLTQAFEKKLIPQMPKIQFVD